MFKANEKINSLLKHDLEGIFDLNEEIIDSDHLEFYYFK